jgi:hypothetical protein
VFGSDVTDGPADVEADQFGVVGDLVAVIVGIDVLDVTATQFADLAPAQAAVEVEPDQ